MNQAARDSIAPESEGEDPRIQPLPMIQVAADDEEERTKQYAAQQVQVLARVDEDEDDAKTVLRAADGAAQKPQALALSPVTAEEGEDEKTVLKSADPGAPKPRTIAPPPPPPRPAIAAEALRPSGLPLPSAQKTLALLPPPPRASAPPPASRSVPPPPRSRSVPPPAPSVLPPPARSVPPPPQRAAAAARAAFAAAHAPPRSKPPASFGIPLDEETTDRGSSIAPIAGTVPPPGRSRLALSRLLLAAAAVGLAVLAAVIAFKPSTGALVVSATGPKGDLAAVDVFVDGVKRCSETPCTIDDMEAGSHLVRTQTEGLDDTAERAVVVVAGETAKHQVAITDSTLLSGLRVAAEGEGLRVFVDGREVGRPPVALDAMQPGDHVVRIASSGSMHQPYEETITLRAGEVRSLGPVRLKALKARLRLDPGLGAEDANVTVDGRPIGKLPAVVELDTNAAHEVRATRAGSSDFVEQIAFDSEGSERSVRVAFEEAAAPAVATNAPARASVSRRAVRRAPKARLVATTKKAPPASGGKGVLNVNSIPVSSVIVDGRPLGLTPVTGISLSEGRHTVVFVHPKRGRKIVTAVVPGGGRATAMTRF